MNLVNKDPMYSCLEKTMSKSEREVFYNALIAIIVKGKIPLCNFSAKRLEGTRYDTALDLLNEAIDRVLRGTRKWEPNVPLAAFLHQTMRSIASVDRRYPVRRALSYEEWIDGWCDCTERPENEYTLSPEELLCKRQDEERFARTIAASQVRLANDTKALAVIESITRCITPTEARKQYSMTEKDYKSARDRLANDIKSNVKENCD